MNLWLQQKLLPLIIFGIFGLGGIIALFYITTNIWQEYFEAKSWQATLCIVEKSEVLSHKSKDNNRSTYKISMQYKYLYQNQWFFGDHYQFFDMFTPGITQKARFIAQYPPGSKIKCYINPSQPMQSVIERDLKLTQLVILFALPLVFTGVGLGGVYRQLKKDPEEINTAGTMTLQEITPCTKFFTVVGVCGFWNIIVLLLFVHVWLPRYLDLQSVLFVDTFIFIPAIIGGIILIFAVIYSFLALFNPNTTLTINSERLQIGKHYMLNFYTNGHVERLLSFTISLVGKRVETVRSGKNTSFIETEFYEGNIYQEANQISPYGLAEFTIPDNLAPSEKKGDIEIKWMFRVKGKLKYWPDMNNEYPVRLWVYQPKSFSS